jgi:hypothetical protein
LNNSKPVYSASSKSHNVASNYTRFPPSEITGIQSNTYIYTGRAQKNGAVLIVDKEASPLKNNVFFKPYMKLTLHCNHRSGHLKTEHLQSLLLLRRHLGNWSYGPAVSMRSKLLVVHETWTVLSADNVCCARIRGEINLLSTFETAPFLIWRSNHYSKCNSPFLVVGRFLRSEY